MTNTASQPSGRLTIQTVPMPRDTNPFGDVFGGWIMSQMDHAAGIAAGRRARGRVVTVGIEAMKFHLPVLIGDVVGCYTEIVRVGRTSIAIKVEVWVERPRGEAITKVTEGIFTFVRIDANRKPEPVGPEP